MKHQRFVPAGTTVAWQQQGLCRLFLALFSAGRHSPGVGTVQHRLGLAADHLLFQVVEHSDPEQHPGQTKQQSQQSLSRRECWASRTNTHSRTRTVQPFHWVKWVLIEQYPELPAGGAVMYSSLWLTVATIQLNSTVTAEAADLYHWHYGT